MFLVGGRVKAGVVGDAPEPDEAGRRATSSTHTDFRRVYAAVLDHWLGVDSKAVLGEGFKPVDVFKA